MAVDHKVVAAVRGGQRAARVKIRHAGIAVFALKVMAQVKVRFVGAVHDREAQVGGVDADPADEIRVARDQRGKAGGVVALGAVVRRRGRRFDEGFKVGKIGADLVVLPQAAAKQRGADDEQQREKSQRDPVKRAAFAARGGLLRRGGPLRRGRRGRLRRGRAAAFDLHGYIPLCPPAAGKL